MDTKTIYQKWRQYQYYVIIGVTSIVALFFLPMIGSSAGLAFVLPTTAAGWTVYVITKSAVAAINVLVFHCFIQQGKLNVANDEKYLAAKQILAEIFDDKEFIPRSPRQWRATTYGKKSITIFVGSLLSAIGLTQAILTFDWVSLLTYAITLLFGVITGILQMNQTEIFWTEEYHQYALYIQKKRQEARKEEGLQGEGIMLFSHLSE